MGKKIDYSDGTVEALTTLYRRGWSMEQIADAMQLSLVYVSQVVHLLGLGDERYKNESIPSKGSVSVVRRAMSMSDTRSGRFGKHGRR